MPVSVTACLFVFFTFLSPLIFTLYKPLCQMLDALNKSRDITPNLTSAFLKKTDVLNHTFSNGEMCLNLLYTRAQLMRIGPTMCPLYFLLLYLDIEGKMSPLFRTKLSSRNEWVMFAICDWVWSCYCFLSFCFSIQSLSFDLNLSYAHCAVDDVNEQ